MTKFWDKVIINKNVGQILVSNLQMTTPYYPQSVLAKSKFHGFYTLFYMFTLYFSVVFPVLNFIKTGNFFEKAYFKILQTNIYWDAISLGIFLLMSLCLMSLSSITKAICDKLTKSQTTIFYMGLVGYLWILYIGIGFYIVRHYPMYFTDKIFIVVMSWTFFIKTLSYIFDIHQIVQINAKFQVQRKQEKKVEQKQQQQQLEEITLVKKSASLLYQSKSNKLKTKLIYLVSPEIIFKRFVMNYNQNLVIHPIYIINKALVGLVCSLVNLIIMIEMIQPLCQKESLQKYRLIELFFRLIPPIFYLNICLYFMILENIIPAIAEATKMKHRIYYEDWWNSETLYDFLDKWVLLINGFTKQYLSLLWHNRKLRELVHVSVILFLIFQIFSTSQRRLSLIPLIILSIGILVLTYFFGGNQMHIIIFAFSPLMLAIEMKYKIFTGQN